MPGTRGVDSLAGPAYKKGMTKKEFARRVMNLQGDALGTFLNFLKSAKIPYCVIGGLAVNAYAEPVVSLDLDIVVASDRLQELKVSLPGPFKARTHPHSLNLTWPGSDLRIQVQRDSRYQTFLLRARVKDVLGYKMRVARIEDVLQGKIWAAIDETRRPSKRQKDLADILRLIEKRKELIALVPLVLKKRLELT